MNILIQPRNLLLKPHADHGVHSLMMPKLTDDAKVKGEIENKPLLTLTMLFLIGIVINLSDP